jgi:hypothetical protein
MLFAHVAHVLIDMLGRQIVMGGCQGKSLGAGAAGKLFRICEHVSQTTKVAAEPQRNWTGAPCHSVRGRK